MTITIWLDTATKFLTARGIPTARLDCLVLLEDTLQINRSQLLAEPSIQLSDPQIAELQKLLRRRAGHEPLAYIRGKTEFYGRNFVVSAAVLEPRPESETMIELLKQLPLFTAHKVSSEAANSPTEHLSRLPDTQSPKVRIADVGAGSGALGITAALELPQASIDLLEVDPLALRVAKTNVDLFTLNISVMQSDLLAQSPQDYDILLCNLPYVPDTYPINRAAAHEPPIAIFGGPDGLDVYRRLFAQNKMVVKHPLYILFEALPTQHAALAQIAQAGGYELLKTDDFIQVFRRV